MKFFVILELILIAALVTVSFFDVPAAALSALIWACVVVGIITLAFVGIAIYKDIKRK